MEAASGLERVVGVAASAGGVEALTQMVHGLPAGLDAAVLVVLHLPATGRSLLAPILGRRTDMEVDVAAAGEPLRAGRIYVAPPDRHLTVRRGHVSLDRGPRRHGARPAADALLESLARDHGERAVAVVLSGALDDGSAGAVAIRDGGGAVIVQDPLDAAVASMPASALRAVGAAAAVLPVAEIPAALTALVATPVAAVRDNAGMPPEPSPQAFPDRPQGAPTAYRCPDCHGPMWDRPGELRSLRCRVGHTYSEDTYASAQGAMVENALWTALEALEERAEFLRRMSSRYGDDRPRLHARYAEAADDAVDRAELIRSALGARGAGPDALDAPAEASA